MIARVVAVHRRLRALRRWHHAGVTAAVLLTLAAPRPVEAQRPTRVLDVPFIPQTEALCGGAAAAMVLRFWGERGVSADSFSQLVDRSEAGIRTTVLVEDLRARGWNASGVGGSTELLRRELDVNRRPVVALIEDRPGTFHYVVVVAITSSSTLFHDPARGPFRALSAQEFDRRWTSAGRWMAVVVPGAGRPAPVPVEGASSPAPADAACQAAVERAVTAVAASDFDAAERHVTSPGACAPAIALRELAGVRAAQRRWAEVAALAGAATAADPSDAAAWRLLATARFVGDDRRGALAAWNAVGEPALDILQVNGLTQTRVPVAIGAVDARPSTVVTPEFLTHTQRRLAAMPAVSSASVAYVPVPGGRAEVRAQLAERPLWPTRVPTWIGIGARAAFARSLAIPIGSLSGGGERVDVSWRFWKGWPRVAADFSAPAPWGGTWSVGALWEQQPFDGPDLPTPERKGAHVAWSDWVSPRWRVSVRGGADRWIRRPDSGTEDGPASSTVRAQQDLFASALVAGTLGRVGAGVTGASLGDRLSAQVDLDQWLGGTPFAQAQAVVRAQSSTERTGPVVVGQIGVGLLSRDAPPDLWFGGDTGRTRPVPLRAHRLAVDGLMSVDRIGRSIAHGSVEGQYWWRTPRVRVAAAAFADTVSLRHRARPGPRHDVDLGLGARTSLPGAGGTLRLDWARGLRDGYMRVSVGFEP